jgi:RNA polymerase sigma factor (sigma-70 family)
MTTLGLGTYDPAATESDGLATAVGAAARGDQAAFKKLYERYATSVYNLVLRSLRNPQAAEDICQEVWVKAYRELHRLDEPQAFPAWLYRIASRACVDAARKNRRFPATTELTDYSGPAAPEDPERSALQKERVRLTWEALAALPARQHLALFLREMDRRSYKEIAQILETSEAAVETLLFRARQSFAKTYERLDEAVQDRCRHAHRSMSALMDGEATPVQKRAVHAHVDACTPCSGELTRMQRAAATYAALVPLPVPALLGERIFDSLGIAGAAASSAGTTGGIVKLLVLSAAKAKIAAVSLVATGAVTAAAMGTPIGESLLPGTPAPPSSQDSSSAPAPRDAFRADPAPGTGPLSAANTETTTAGDTSAAASGLAPDTEALTDTITATVPNLNATVAGAGQTVDSLLHEVEAAANEAVPLPPLPEVPPVIPTPPPVELPAQLPELPAALPTPPPLPGLP